MIDLVGLNNLITSEYFGIDNNNSLIDLNGLNNVTNIDRLSITNNPALESLDGLEKLESVLTLSAYFNPQLSNVDALARLSSFDLMHVNYNELLSECCGLMLAINSQEEGDYLSIGNNLAGCNSIEEVVDSCDVLRFAVDDISNKIFQSKSKVDFSLSGSSEVEILNQFEVHPNPFDNSLMVKSNHKLGSAKIQLFDIRGVLILSDIITTTEKRINTTELSSGVYLLRIEGAEFLQTIKIVKD